MITIKDMAEIAGVSPTTVANVLNVEGDIEKGAGCDRSIPLRFKYGGTRSGKLWLQNYRSYHEL